MLQVELWGDAVLVQRLFDLGEVDGDGDGRRLLCLDGCGVFQPRQRLYTPQQQDDKH